jgi:hypothetical protein
MMDSFWTPREMIDAKIADLRTLLHKEIVHERELREKSEEAHKVALNVAETEIARRFEVLNGNNENVERILSNVVSRGQFDTYIQTQAEIVNSQKLVERTWREGVEKRISDTRGATDEWRESVDRQLSEARGSHDTKVYLMGIGLVLLNIALRFLP